MYCSGCGTQLQADLNYCNRCGNRVAGESDRMSVAKNLSGSMGYIPGVGFFSYIFVIIALVKNGVPGDLLALITFFYFAALFAICLLVVRQSAALSRSDRQDRLALPDSSSPGYAAPRATTARLRELHEPAVGSIIEHTTKTLDEVRSERR